MPYEAVVLEKVVEVLVVVLRDGGVEEAAL